MAKKYKKYRNCKRCKHVEESYNMLVAVDEACPRREGRSMVRKSTCETCDYHEPREEREHE